MVSETDSDDGYPRPVDEQERLDEEIKIQWNQSQASRASMFHSLKASFSDANPDEPLIGAGLRALDRQKTNVVVKTVEEAASLLYELDSYLSEYGLNTPKGAGTRPYERVRRELETELENSGYTVTEREVGRPDVSSQER